MAVGEKRNTNQISQVSWVDWTAMDVYYWMDHSFQYSSNINCDDELHWLKLSTKAYFTTHFAGCQLTSVWDNGVVALDVTWLAKPKWFDQYTFFSGGTAKWDKDWYYSNSDYHICPWVVFQDYFWFPITDSQGNNMLSSIRVTWDASDQYTLSPRDHPEATDESIEDASTAMDKMDVTNWVITAILNYNNTRLVVACWQEIWVYYPELDEANPVTHPHNTVPLEDHWKTWWKKVLTYEAWVTIVGLTCSFECLKTWCVDEWWNTKVYYYQGNNNLRNTFVYNLVDLTWVRVLRVYNINGIDYYVSSLDGTDGFVNLYKLVWTTPVELFKTRAWLDQLDVNFKAPYFVWPVWLNAAYCRWKFYIADAYGLFQFTYNPQWFDKWYMKWWLYNNVQVYWVCENQWYLYVSTEWWCYIMRVIDTWLPVPESKNGMEITYKDEWYQPQWVLISREFEWKEWWTFTKMLDEIRLNYELNPWTNYNWMIDIYVSPNNLWKNTHSFTEASNWYHVMHIEQKNWKTRTEKSNLFNDLGNGSESSFKFDWQTITYAIVITRYDAPNNPSETQLAAQRATPIVRQIDLRYHVKDKTNNVYDIN
jgi:hypothetical protein